MFFRLLHNIRQKPKETRQFIALCASGGITLLIFGVWAVSYTAYVSDRLAGNSLFNIGTDEMGRASETLANGYTNLKEAKEKISGADNLAAVSQADILSGITASTTASTTLSGSDASSTSTIKPQNGSSTATTSPKKLVE